jgi:hypothetical protein
MKSEPIPFLRLFFLNACITCMFALTFRFGTWLISLGENAQTMGWIVSMGVGFGMIYKFVLNRQISRIGMFYSWLLSIVFAFSGALGLGLIDHYSIWVSVWRALLTCGYAGSIVSGIICVQLMSPRQAVTQTLARFSSSVFIGLAAGSIIGDIIVQTAPSAKINSWLFLAASAFALIAMTLVTTLRSSIKDLSFPKLALVSASEMMGARPSRTSRWAWKSWAAAICLLLGGSFSLPQLFLAPYATSRGISSTSVFFVAYCISAFAIRASGWANFSKKNRLDLIAMSCFTFCLSFASYLLVDSPLILVWPGLLTGIGRGILEPALIVTANDVLSPGSKARASIMVSNLIDAGLLIFSSVFGLMIRKFGYSSLFVTGSALFFFGSVVTGVITLRERRQKVAKNSVLAKPSGASDERRTAPRLESEPIFVYISAGSIHVRAVLTDISSFGICVRMAEGLERTSAYQLKLGPFDLTGQVMWSAQKSSIEHLVGFRIKENLDGLVRDGFASRWKDSI